MLIFKKNGGVSDYYGIELQSFILVAEFIRIRSMFMLVYTKGEGQAKGSHSRHCRDGQN